MTDIEKIRQLLQKTDWTYEESKWVSDYITGVHKSLFLEVARDFYQDDLDHQVKIEKEISDRLYKGIRDKLDSQNKDIVPVTSVNKNTAAISYWTYGRVAAIIVLVLLVGGGTLYFSQNEKSSKRSVSMEDTNNVQTDIAPGQNGAVLTLANGSTIVLDSTGNGVIAHQAGMIVSKLPDGQLVYNTVRKNVAPLNGTEMMNTLSTPKGRFFQVRLPDGSKVWLNASSSLKYPIAFTGKERSVELNGEGYFEVAKNKQKPFVVHIQQRGVEQGSVEVLGTHFNIKAYEDEPWQQTTLLEGAIAYRHHNKRLDVHPGQQVYTDVRSDLTLMKMVDTEDIVAWVNGNFNFHNTPLTDIMRQLARWYEVDVVYKGTVQYMEFDGIISRSNSLQKVLKVLQLGGINIEVNGRQITVLASPNNNGSK